jgi:hypothetical protein
MAQKANYARRPAPQGLDFVPVEGGAVNLTFGVVRRQIGAGPSQTVGQTVKRRLCIGDKSPADAPWVPNCHRWDVLLPANAPESCADPKTLCDRYEKQAFPTIKDLVVMATLRFPDPDRLHQSWEKTRAFARERLCEERNIAVIMAMHLPISIGSTNPPHVHLMMPARSLHSYGFGEFVRPLATDHGKDIIARELAGWFPDHQFD